MAEPIRFENDELLYQWLREQMNSERKWLLAHADDGVIWGRLDASELITSHDIAPNISPELRLITLQQAFIFGWQDEVRLWRDERGWLFYLINDSEETDYIDETQILWGTEVIEFPEGSNSRGFTHLRESKQQGLDHVVPIEVINAQLRERRLKLRVRHFITRDDTTGEARITLSRLVSLETV